MLTENMESVGKADRLTSAKSKREAEAITQGHGWKMSRREVSKRERRDAIIAAARTSFLQHGYARTSMSGLLATLGGSKGTIWAYFRSKEELFSAVIDQISTSFHLDLREILTVQRDTSAEIGAFCTRFLQQISSPEAVSTWRVVIAESGQFPELGRIFFERVAGVTERTLSDYFRQRVALGHLGPENPVTMAKTLVSLCLSWHNRILLGVETFERAVVDGEALRVSELFMRAYGTQAKDVRAHAHLSRNQTDDG